MKKAKCVLLESRVRPVQPGRLHEPTVTLYS